VTTPAAAASAPAAAAPSTLQTVQKVVDFSISAFEAVAPSSKKTLEGVRSFVDKTLQALDSFSKDGAKDTAKTDPKKATSKKPAKKPAAKKSAKAPVKYTVKHGDTLWDIGRRYGVSYQSIAKANHIQNPDLIYPGQVFKIPNAKPSGARTSSSSSANGHSSFQAAPSTSPSATSGTPGKDGSWSPNGSGHLTGADTSHWQSGGTFEQSIAGKQFSAIKATDGTGYVDPSFKQRWNELGQKIAQGKMSLRIAYQFMQPGNGTAQANHFLDTLGVHGKLPAGTRLALDWEASSLKDPKALHDAANRIHDVTGVWPLIYTSASQVSRARAAVPQAPMWEAKWSGSAPGNVPFVQTSDGPGFDHDVFNGDLAALRKFAGF